MFGDGVRRRWRFVPENIAPLEEKLKLRRKLDMDHAYPDSEGSEGASLNEDLP